MIGIGITTFNRKEVLSKALENHKKYLPEGARLVVVDDASTYPVASDYRFNQNVGIATAKNKCLELLEGCEHIFLFDDDTWPIVKDWHLPYIDSGIKHLSFTFPSLASGRKNGRKFLNSVNGLSEYGSPCGCMLYIHRDVVNKIGGFDMDYPKWGMEHVDYSNRTYNARLTPSKYLDISNSLELFYSLDHQQETTGTVHGSIKRQTIPNNRLRFKNNRGSKEYIPYKNSTKGIILASYFNSVDDPQRGIRWKADIEPLCALIESCEANNLDYRIFHDCLDIEGKNFVKVKPQSEYAPSVFRWFVYNEWLSKNKVDNVFMVDSTDVEVLKNPFLSLNPNKLYVGNEYNNRVNNSWMRKNQEIHLKSLSDYRSIISQNAREILLNCGIVGGSYEIVMEYIGYRVYLHELHTKDLLKSTDMAIFNYLIWKYFKGRTTSGVKVNTRFKVNEYNEVSFFKHK